MDWKRDLRRYGPTVALGAAAVGWYAADSLRHRREGAFGYDLAESVAVDSPGFLRAAEALTGAPISEGNDAELLINGRPDLPRLSKDDRVREADALRPGLRVLAWRHRPRGGRGDRPKAKEGVDCKVILDALGAAKMDRSLIGQMQDAGVEVVLLRPPKPYAIRRVASRTHRRLLMADGRVGMTGGVGIAAEWTGNAEDPNHWRDTHVRVRGPVVRGMQGAFAENWLEGTGQVLAGDDYLPDLEPIADGGPMQLVRSSATVGDTNVEALYYLAIASTKRSMDLTTAYFVPRPAFTDALAEAARRGVEVRILVPGPHSVP